jgi:AcrR family transcriptional regulator
MAPVSQGHRELSGSIADAGEAPDSATQLRILQAGSACLAEFGNEKTSVQDVADAAGLSRATIYRYWPDRASLLHAVAAYERGRQLTEVRARAAGTRTLEEALAVVVEVSAATARRFRTREHLRNRDRGLAQYLLFEHTNDLQALRELVAPYVERAAAAGELEPDLDAHTAIEWIVSFLAMIPALPAADAPMDDPAAVGPFFARRLCRGLVAPSARRTRR